ncbi:MAG: hypothetical protein AB1792_08820, partial [Candidatus Zixiibacteriota bacterium]
MDSSSRYATSRWCVALAVFAVVLVAFGTGAAWAQDTVLYIRLPDLCARPCEWLRIPVNITNLTEPVSGYQLSYTFSRPNLVSFDP